MRRRRFLIRVLYGPALTVVLAWVACYPLLPSCGYKIRRLVLEVGAHEVRPADGVRPGSPFHARLMLSERRGATLVELPKDTDQRALSWAIESFLSTDDVRSITLRDAEDGTAIMTLPVADPKRMTPVLRTRGTISRGSVRCHRREACYRGPILTGGPSFERLFERLEQHGGEIEIQATASRIIEEALQMRVEGWHRPQCG